MSFFDRLADRFELDEFNKHHKTAFILLGCAAILVVILWVVQLRKNIVNPLYGGVDPNALKTQTAVTTNTDDQLRAKDTDGDGLSDWDELNIYKTSPYLPDSDSDGVADREEILKGADPNCPTGQTCSTATTEDTTPSLTNPAFSNILNGGTTTTVTPQVSPQTTTNSSGLTTDEKNALKQILGTTQDPATLRQFLIQAGGDKNYINSISDADLQKVINEILK